jgi:uncharacterized membrane protein
MGEKKKYDTNPLEEGVAQRAEDEWGAVRSGQGSEGHQPSTEQVKEQWKGSRPTSEYEAPTRRMDAGFNASYPSVFVPPVYQPPASHGQQPYPLSVGKPACRAVQGLKLPENIAMVLPYAPAYIGVVAAIIELLLVPRSELRVRFHAAQGLALQLAIIAITLMFSLIGTITGSHFGGGLFSLAAFVFLIVSMVRVWKGKPHHIAPLDDATKWINAHIEQKK